MAKTTLKVATVRQHVAKAECKLPLREAFNTTDNETAAIRNRV